jgi:hypothetical protein
MIISTILAIGAAGLAAAECTREKLLATADLYVAGLQSGSLDDFKKEWADSVSYTENNKDSTVESGVISKTLTIDHNRTTADTTACVSFTEIVSTAGPYVIGTQIHHEDDKVNAIEVIVATTGSWAFNAQATLSHIATEDWGPLDAEDQTSREVLKNAIDAYLDMWNGGPIEDVPWGSPCARTEGSAYVTPDCRSGAPNGGSLKIGNRRYVIDEVTGSAEAFCAFGTLPDSHELRLIDGKVRLVHTITV